METFNIYELIFHGVLIATCDATFHAKCTRTCKNFFKGKAEV